MHEEGLFPLALVPITGPDKADAAIEAAIRSAAGLVVAVDGPFTLPESTLHVFMPEEGGLLARFSCMSRYLSGRGMGPFVFAAQKAGNKEIWDANADGVRAYREMEAVIQKRAAALPGGVEATIVRAGTLKGGASGSANDPQVEGGGGEPSFLNKAFYSLGQQDAFNWRLIYDTSCLGVKIARGNTLPGPGLTAALTATDRCGAGDSHRGAVATALVEALRVEVAGGGDFSVAVKEAEAFPPAEAWPALFANAK